MKKILLFVFIFLCVLFSTSCEHNKELKEIENIIIDDNLDDTYLSDIKMISKYNDVYVYALLFENYQENTYTKIGFDDVVIYSSNLYAYLGGVYNKEKYDLEQLYYMGLLTKEDIVDIDSKFDQEKDTYEEVSSKGHLHQVGERKVVESTCTIKGSEKIFCSICHLCINELTLEYDLHNYINGICISCNKIEEKVSISNEIVEQNLLLKLSNNSYFSNYESLEIESCFGVYDDVYIYQVTSCNEIDLTEPISFVHINDCVFVNWDSVKIFGFYNDKIYTLKELYDNQLISLNVIKSLYNTYTYNKYFDINIVNKILVRKLMINNVFEKYILKQMPKKDKNQLQISINSIKELNGLYVGKVTGLLTTYYDEYKIGEYNFKTKQGIICICKDNVFYTIKEAYEQKIISIDDVEVIYENYN